MGITRSILATTMLVPMLPTTGWAQATSSPFTTAVRYDAAHRVVGTIEPDPDGVGPLRHLAVRNTYDVAGRLVRVEKGELSVWQGQAVAPTSWTGFTVHKQVDTEYDALDRKLFERVSGDGNTLSATQYGYDAAGRSECTAVRMNPAEYDRRPASACALGPEGRLGPDRISRNGYDAAGQLVKVEKAVGTPLRQDYASYSYTANAKRASVTDANGNRAEMKYDGFDRQSHWYFPSKTSLGAVSTDDYEKYEYDANGNREIWRRRDGRVLTFGYDALNRIVRKTVPDGCAPNQLGGCPDASATRDVAYGYDLRGLQSSARFIDGQGEVASAYDGFSRLTSSTLTMAGVSRTVSARYDGNGNRTEVTTPGGTWTYTYDGLDRLSALYEGVGTATIMSLWTYNPQGLPQSVAERFGSNAGWSYDSIGRTAGQTDTFAGGTGNTTTTLGYNPASQIVSRARSNTGYAFTGQYAVIRDYGVNALNQYISAGPARFMHDVNGNLIADGTTSYVYDAENRLVGASNGTTLTYDPLGRLYQVLGSSRQTRFLYDGDQLVAEFGSGDTLTNAYVHGPGADDPLLWYPAGDAARWYHRDHQGSIVATATGPAGTLAGINTYDEYGIPGANNRGRFQYTGQAFIPELGMYHYKARVYSPTLGRFLQTDPIGYDDQLNLYAYVANDPVNLKDVTGERITVVMHQVTFGPYQSGSYHMKIVVIPDDQKTFRNDERFSNRQNGVAFATIGAGPDTWKNVAGPLVSGVNRGTDVAKVKSRESFTIAELKPDKGDTENNLINRLFGVAGSYKNDLDYSLSPSAGGRDYNSNSFVQGVLAAVGAGVTTPAGVSLPGADKPVPRTEFCTPGKDGCAR